MGIEKELKGHRDKVDNLIGEFVKELNFRGWEHDESKAHTPEREILEGQSDKMKSIPFGTPEYYKGLEEVEAALVHHYAHNRHHPQYFENGICGMNLIDLIEMFCDWKASVDRHPDGDFGKSIEHNAGRFKMSEQLVKIFENTKRDLAW